MIKPHNLLLLFILCSTYLIAQNHIKGSITGTVIIESTKKPLEFVNVVVMNQADSSLITGSVTDNKGKFEIVTVPDGIFFIRYSILGYEEKQSANFKIDNKHRNITFGNISLKETSLSVGDVTVTSQRTTFVNSIDRKIYNVQQDILSKTGSASDLLQNIPSIQVDIDGTVSLRGSENVPFFSMASLHP